MPCNSDHMHHTSLEQYRQKTAKLYVFLLEMLARPSDMQAVLTAADVYAKEDFTAHMCGVFRSLGRAHRDKVLYGNPKNKIARELATWWEEHEEADRKREKQEALAKQDATRRKKAAAKLTSLERKVLGIDKDGNRK